jgi:hypothetical protein
LALLHLQQFALDIRVVWIPRCHVVELLTSLVSQVVCIMRVRGTD